MSMHGKKKGENFWDNLDTVEMDLREVQEVLSVVPADQSVMVWGGPGVGKTQIVEGFSKSIEASCRTVVTSTYEPTDIGGVPMPATGKDGSTQYIRYLVAKWAFDATVASKEKGPMVILFDDLTTAHEQVQAACYRLFLDREIGDLRLRDNVRIIAAGNRPEDNAATNDMPTPLGNRMLHLYARPHPEVWTKWAVNEANIHPWIVGYIRTHPNKIYTFRPDSAEKAFASPRSWQMLSRNLYALEKAGRNNAANRGLRSKLTAGLIGHGLSIEFYQWVKMTNKSVSPEQIVKNPRKAKVPDELDVAHATLAAAESYLKNNPLDWEAFLIYTLRMEPELGLLLALQISKVILYSLPDEEREKALLNEQYTELFDKYGNYIV